MGPDAHTVSKTGAREGVWVRAERPQLVSAEAGRLVSREPTEDRRRRPQVNPTGSALWHNDSRGSITREGYGG